MAEEAAGDEPDICECSTDHGLFAASLPHADRGCGDGSGDAGGIHHRLEVLHPDVQRQLVDLPIGETVAAGVVANERVIPLQIAFRPGLHRLVARPTGAPADTLPRVTWSRRIEIGRLLPGSVSLADDE